MYLLLINQLDKQEIVDLLSTFDIQLKWYMESDE